MRESFVPTNRGGAKALSSASAYFLAPLAEQSIWAAAPAALRIIVFRLSEKSFVGVLRRAKTFYGAARLR
jgi:hypothetical protein